MLITSIQELRLVSPSHAFDTIDGLVGFIDNSEHGFLEDKLGTPLYNALCQWYDQNLTVRSSVADYQTGYWNRLLLMAQRVVGFDALGRSAGMQGVSVNNAGINMGIADDYPKADRDAIDTYRKTCFTEALKSCDLMLAELERWTTEAAATAATTAATPATVPDGSPAPATVPDGSPSGEGTAVANSPLEDERSEIVSLWRQSRYFYLAASMLIPSAVVLQQYLDFDESREKFIRMLPDLRFIQEEIIANSIGEEYLDHLIDVAVTTAGDGSPITTKSPVELRIIHQLRRVIVAWLISRTKVLKYDKEAKLQAHDDGVRKMQDACDFIRRNQHAILCALDVAAGFPATAAAELSPQDRDQLEEDVLQGCLEAEAPFTASPLYTAVNHGDWNNDRSAAGDQGSCPRDAHCPNQGNTHHPSSISHQTSSGLSMLVTEPLL